MIKGLSTTYQRDDMTDKDAGRSKREGRTNPVHTSSSLTLVPQPSAIVSMGHPLMVALTAPDAAALWVEEEGGDEGGQVTGQLRQEWPQCRGLHDAFTPTLSPSSKSLALCHHGCRAEPP
jgi:hypothetical protein